MEVVGIEMGGFEAINGDGIVTTVFDCKVFISPFDDLVRSIIGGLRTASCQIKTWVAVDKPSMMLLFC